MLPTIVSERTAVLVKETITLPALVPGSVFIGPTPCQRIVLRGGHAFEAPASAAIPLPQQTLSVAGLLPGLTLYAPLPSRFPAPAPIPYDYEAADNKGNLHRFQGDEPMDEVRAELLGWLVGDGSIKSETQSIRFANTDVWCLQRVEALAAKAFPTVKVGWYAKSSGYDITLTGGISNPLRHFLRCMRFAQGFPIALNLLDLPCRVAFLRGLWGADGWCYIRKGGNDVDLGLSGTDNHAYSSLLRMFHATTLGMNGQVRSTATKANPDAHRIVFSGYPNYRLFFNLVGQIRHIRLTAPPPVRKLGHPLVPVSDANGEWSLAPIQRITRTLPTNVYHLPKV